MAPPNLKRLITGFLILAAAAGSSAFVFSNLPPSPPPPPQNTLTVLGESAPTAGAGPRAESPSAYGPTLPAPAAPAANVAASQPVDRSNLTDVFVQNAANQLVDNNPGGPATDENGTPLLNLPDEGAMTRMIVEAVAKSPVALTKPVPDSLIKIGDRQSDDDLASYAKQINDIVAGTVAGKEFTSVINSGPGDGQISSVRSTVRAAMDQLAALTVPRPFADLHRRLLTILADQESILDAISNYRIDPLKAMVAIQSFDEIINRDAKNLRDESEKIPAKISALTPGLAPRGSRSMLSFFMEHTVSIPTANAIMLPIVHDPLHTVVSAVSAGANTVIAATATATWAKKLWEWIYDTILRMMVNRLLDQFQNQVVNWIAGGGKPKFVTDWQGFLEKAGNDAAALAIQRRAPGLCTSFGRLIQAQLRDLYVNEQPLTCTIDQVVANVEGFYNDFSSGGWVAFGAMTLPQNDYYSQFYQSINYVSNARNAARQSKSQETGAASGFLGVKECKNPKTFTFLKTDEPPPEISTALQNGYSPYKGPDCDKNDNCTVVLCKADDLQNVTPGAAVGHSLFGSMNWKPNAIVSAKRLEELASALLNAAFNRMVQFGLSSLTEALNGTPATAAGSSGGTGGSTTPQDTSNFNALADTVEGQLERIVTNDSNWLAAETQAVPLLEQVSSTCAMMATSTAAGIAADASSKAANLEALVPTVQDELAEANVSLDDLAKFKADFNAATSDDERSAIIGQFNEEFDASAIADLVESATTRRQTLATLRANAQANLPNACNMPLSGFGT
jgi:hypothetical protein